METKIHNKKPDKRNENGQRALTHPSTWGGLYYPFGRSCGHSLRERWCNQVHTWLNSLFSCTGVWVCHYKELTWTWKRGNEIECPCAHHTHTHTHTHTLSFYLSFLLFATYPFHISEFRAFSQLRRPDVVRMIDWTAQWIQKLGGKTETHNIGTQTLHDGSVIPLPPILTAVFGDDPNKKTVSRKAILTCLYMVWIYLIF